MQQRFPGKPTKHLQDVWAQASKIIPAVNRAHWHDWDFQWAVESCNGRKGYHAITESCWEPGGQKVATEIQGYADTVLKALPGLRKAGTSKTWTRTLGDLESMAHLGLYYAEKFRAADTKKKQPKQAIEHLEKAAAHWENYADVAGKQYTSQLLSKGGWAGWQDGYKNALKDIELLKNPGAKRKSKKKKK